MHHLRGLISWRKGAPVLEPRHNLTVLYRYLVLVFAIVLTALTLGLFWNLGDLVALWSGTPSEAQLVDLAGRQRMLSERLVKDVLLSRAGADPAQRAAALARAAATRAELRAVQDHLRSDSLRFLRQDPADHDGAARVAMVDSAFQQLDDAAEAVLGGPGPEQNAGAAARDLSLAAWGYQAAMSAHLERFAALAAANERRAKLQMGAALIAAYLAAAALAWPILRRVRRSVHDLVEAHRALEAEHTQRLRARREYDRLVVALEQSPNAVLVCESDGRISFANRGIERICPDHACHGFAAMHRAHAQESPPVYLQDLCMMRPEMLERLQETLAAGQIWHARKLCAGACGREMAISALPVREPDGSVSGWVAMIRDTTRERRMEAYLRESQKLEAVGTLVSGVAHDFNNALQVIAGYLELALKRAGQDQQLREDLGQAAHAVRGASAVTRQLLAFVRRHPPARQPHDLNALVADHAGMVRRVLRRDVRLELTPHREALSVEVEPGALEQVLLNLYLNAQDAMPSGGRLSVTLDRLVVDEEFRVHHPWAAAASYATIAVRDEGQGMPPEVLARVFDPFFTTKEVGKGTGLGLTAAYGIMRQHGGMVTVDSVPGAGTAVTLYLPANGPALPPPPPFNGGELVQARGNETVLLALADETARRMLAAALEERGYRVLTAENGESALSAAAAADLVVMETGLPQLSGAALHEALQARKPGLPVLALAAAPEDPAASALAERGVFVVRPPYSPAALLKLARTVLDRCALLACGSEA